MSNSSSVVLTTVLKLIDKYDLYGQVAYPKHHKQSEVPEIYRLAAKTKVIFIHQVYERSKYIDLREIKYECLNLLINDGLYS